MVFCMRGLWNIVPCRNKASEKVMKSTYLKTYETLQSEDDSNSLVDNDGMDEMLTKDSFRGMKSRGSERKMPRKIRKGASMSSEVKIDERKKQTTKSNSMTNSDDSWSDSYEDTFEKTEFRSSSKEKRKNRERYDKKESRSSRRVFSEDSSSGDAQGGRRSSKAMDMASKKSEILEKYRNRIYSGDKRHYNSDDISKESDMESSNYGKKERSTGSTSKQRPDEHKDSHNLDDSESEISFIMDIYDKSSLNNSLREKMFEYLKQMERKG
ncbi:hypothetical protein EROM_070360 [Encephalitozoon romaleae SJ-2008]|uniref:Uncharacterized protein n=1 Tax=Encephalitozoon romaleae (strain SJ-2008) TaxID=1178016 RepID=I7AS90_ENCRO|nr:hypothetical protein EROM_070360 [Encephalitozoon romaleae SJ-2008]AFN83287.1 hypothetical protein EROM_070360 [Encephalitozoon romaleae SJ-2008]